MIFNNKLNYKLSSLFLSMHIDMFIYFNKTCNTQVASRGKVPTKPGSCNRCHISKLLEHLTGLLNLQPSHKPLVRQAPYRHPSHSSQMAQWKEKKNKWGKGGNTENC